MEVWQVVVIVPCGLFLILVSAMIVVTLMDRMHYLAGFPTPPDSFEDVLDDF